MLITCEEDSLRHKYLDDVHKYRGVVKFEAYHVENILFLFTELVFAGIEFLLGLCLTIHFV